MQMIQWFNKCTYDKTYAININNKITNNMHVYNFQGWKMWNKINTHNDDNDREILLQNMFFLNYNHTQQPKIQ